MKICLYTPGLKNHEGSFSDNLGDLIIQEAVTREIHALFDSVDWVKLPSHIFPTSEHVKTIHACDLAVVGGSNLLESEMNKHKKWKVSWRQQLFAPNPVLLGVGWRVYQDSPNLYTCLLLQQVLSKKWWHSVRDSFTLKQLKAAGIKQVLNTGCPTMWPFMDFRFDKIPCTKADTALAMITDYEADPIADRKLLALLAAQYENVLLWPQGSGDETYLLELIQGLEGKFTMLEHSFDAFLSLLSSDLSFDYIGTRLHGGIKCLLSGRRSLIIEIDNRAAEIARDTQLPTVERTDFEFMQNWINQSAVPNIHLNESAIVQWRSQFNCLSTKKELAMLSR